MRHILRKTSIGFNSATRRPRQRGFVLIALTLSLFMLLGMVGLAVDLGRQYVVKNESQSFCDSAAMFAALELNKNGTVTATEITNAVNKATWVTEDANGPQLRFEFGTRQFQNVVVRFAKAWNAPESDWVDAATASGDPTDYHFVRVTTQNPVRLWFLPLLVGATSGSVGASAVAGRSLVPQMVQGLAPFAPIQVPEPDNGVCTAAELTGCSVDPNDKFGMVQGQWYTLRWLSGNLQTSDLPNFCPGDRCPCMLKLANLSGAASAGYAMYNGAADIRQAIVGTPPLTTPITEGSTLDLKNGQVQTEMNALDTRVNQDSDSTSNHYDPAWDGYPFQTKTASSYTGNGRRIVVVPIQSAAGAADGNTKSNTVVGFAGLYLGPSGTYSSGHASTVGACAQYLGTFTIGAPSSGGGGGGGAQVYEPRLYR